MGYKKNEIIEAYKTVSNEYYVIVLDDIGEQYKPVLNAINKYIQEYISNPNNLIVPKDSNSLVMLLKYLNNKVVSKLKLKDNNTGNYNNIDLLNILWDIYTRICYKLNNKPTILRYCIFVNIDNTTINEWKKGNISKPLYTQSAKKWLAECESNLFDEVVNNNSIGSMFILKSNYGYRETVNIVTEQQKDIKSIEEIAEDYTNILPTTNNPIEF